MAVAGSNLHGDSDSPAPGGRGGANGRRGAGGPLVFVINSNLAEGRDVQRQILEKVQTCGFRGTNFFAVNLALEEALVNAIKHGNRLDPNKKVKVHAKITPKKAEIMIEDEGPGFDRSSVPDPTVAENLEKCSGRGILLIEAYMTQVSWDRGGRRLRMVKINKPDPSSGEP
ncbi:MAG TPA: ATP-binding protein [Tepidisphaeraceae bacterium]|jgi:serine/threonine-protein kinase RsbW